MKFVTSDTHFNHKAALRYQSDTRPFESVDDMNEHIIAHWNQKISNNDIIYHLGDFAFGKVKDIEPILESLNGNKVFVLGNHDYNDNRKVRLLETYGEVHYMLHNYVNYKGLRFKLIMCHFHISHWDSRHYGSVHLFGHSHGKLDPDGHCIDVGWDAHQRILTLDEAIEMCLNKSRYA